MNIALQIYRRRFDLLPAFSRGRFRDYYSKDRMRGFLLSIVSDARIADYSANDERGFFFVCKFLEWNLVLNFQKIPNPAKKISIKRLVHKDFGIVDRSRKKIANRLWIFDEPTTAKMDAHISRPRAIGFRLRRLINSPDWNNSAVRIAAVESY